MIRRNIAYMLYDALNKCQKLEVNEKKKLDILNCLS